MKICLLLILLILPTTALAAEPLLDQPRWALEVQGGIFKPALKDWSSYYGRTDIPEYGASLAYRFSSQLELGAGAGWSMAKGSGRELFHGDLSGRATYNLFPLEVFGTLRGVFVDDQLLIPYIGGGWTRVYYRESIQEGGTVRGFADGYHVKLGLEISLNGFDQNATTRMYEDYGVSNTSFFFEAKYTHAVVRAVSADLGGTAYLGGLLFEF